MLTTLKHELGDIYAFLKRNRSEIIVVSLTVLFLMLARYHRLDARWQTSLFYYAILPCLSIIVLLRRNPLDFGLRLGDYKVWGFHLLVACPIAFLLIYLGTSTAEIHKYYAARHFDPLGYVTVVTVRLFAWEFIIRGFLLFGLKDKLKEGAIIVQMIPFALLHLGKPEAEAISCIFSGLYFGYLCYRTNSFWPSFILHCFINYCTKFLSVYSG